MPGADVEDQGDVGCRRVATQDLARLLAEAAQLRGQLETLAGYGDREVRLEQAVAALTDIRTLLMQALGRER